MSRAVSRLATQSRDWHTFPDSENAQRNLEIAQIPRLRGTYAYVCMHVSQYVCVDSRRVKLLVSVSAPKCRGIRDSTVRQHMCVYIRL